MKDIVSNKKYRNGGKQFGEVNLRPNDRFGSNKKSEIEKPD
jgi:hypothetical protein